MMETDDGDRFKQCLLQKKKKKKGVLADLTCCHVL